MKKILGLVLIVTCSACAAFDSDSKTLSSVTPAGTPSVAAGANQFEGFYSGKVKQGSNTCESADLSVQGEELQVDVLQAGDVISVAFADGKTSDGNLEDGNKVTIKVDRSGVAWLYTFSFDEAKASGSIDVVETTIEGNLDAACAKYDFSLEKQKEKPEGFGESKK